MFKDEECVEGEGPTQILKCKKGGFGDNDSRWPTLTRESRGRSVANSPRVDSTRLPKNRTEGAPLGLGDR